MLTNTVDTTVVCASCGVTVDVSNTVYNWEGRMVCYSCQEAKYVSCGRCDCLYPRGTNMTEVIGQDGSSITVCPSCLSYGFTRCNDCGNYHDDGNVVTTAYGENICEDCYNNDYITCGHCGRIYHVDNVAYSENLEMYICEDCLSYCYSTCERCSGIVRDGDTVSVLVTDTGDRETWCTDCLDEYGYRCAECGTYVSEAVVYIDDNDECFCPECHTPGKCQDVIKSYHHHKGRLNDFYLAAGEDSANVLTFGVELEIDEGGFDHDNARQILGNFRGASVVAERDGSLVNGFEMISYPFSLKYYKETMRDDYEKAFKTAVSLGYVSHNTDTCGLHVHVGRQSLGADKDQQTDTISKIWLLMYRFQEAFTLLSRRKLHKLNQWARMPKTEDLGVDSISELMLIEENLKVKVKALDGNQCVERRIALNLQNSKTIEFRLFRGTLNINTFTATLQLVHNVCYLCKILTLADVSNITWTEFVRLLATDSPELLSYLKSKNLYTA